MILDKLKAAGLREREAQVYLAILEAGQASASEIADRAGLKRTTVYDLVSDLAEKGLVMQGYKGRTRIFFAEDPMNLMDIPRRQQETIMGMMPLLRNAYLSASDRPKIRVWEGLDGMRAMEWDMLDNTDSAYYYFASSSTLLDTLGVDFYRQFSQERVRRGIWSHAIRMAHFDVEPHDFMKAGKANMRRVRFYPLPLDCPISALTITDNTLYISSSHDQSYISIRSESLCAMMRSIWQLTWTACKRPPKKKT